MSAVSRSEFNEALGTLRNTGVTYIYICTCSYNWNNEEVLKSILEAYNPFKPEPHMIT